MIRIKKTPSKTSVQSNTSYGSGLSVASDKSGARYRDVRQRYRWKSSSEYVLISLAATLSVRNMYKFTYTGRANEPTVLHYLVAFIIVAYPMCYIKTFIGQYSQLGCISYKYLNPLGHGICYGFVLNSILKCIDNSIFSADLLMYTLTSMQNQLQWMICPKNVNETTSCWDSSSSCRKECINEKTQSSVYIYWRYIYMKGANLESEDLGVALPIPSRTVTLGVTWILVYLIVKKDVWFYVKIIRINLYVSLLLITILLLACFATQGSSKGVGNMFMFNFLSFVDLDPWIDCVIEVVQMVSVCTVLHARYGSYMSPNTKSDTLSAIPLILNYIISLLGSIFTNGTLSIVAHNANVNEDNIRYIWKKGFIPFLMALPQGLGFMGIPQIWTIIYFTSCVLLHINNTVTQIDAIEKTISDSYSVLTYYRTYVLAIICLTGMSCGILLLSSKAYTLHRLIMFFIIKPVEIFGITFTMILICWVYGVTRISDDVHFLLGYQPKTLWKFCWYFLPFLFSFIFIRSLLTDKWAFLHSGWLQSLIFFIIISPFPFMTIYEIFKAVQAQNMARLLHWSEKWGPPDPEERLLRRKFNPRKETRFRRRNDKCEHKCLLRSKVLKIMVDEEENFRRNMLKNRSRANSIDNSN